LGIIAIASTLMAVAITDRVVKGAGEVSRSRANVEHAHACLSGFGLGRLLMLGHRVPVLGLLLLGPVLPVLGFGLTELLLIHC